MRLFCKSMLNVVVYKDSPKFLEDFLCHYCHSHAVLYHDISMYFFLTISSYTYFFSLGAACVHCRSFPHLGSMCKSFASTYISRSHIIHAWSKILQRSSSYDFIVFFWNCNHLYDYHRRSIITW